MGYNGKIYLLIMRQFKRELRDIKIYGNTGSYKTHKYSSYFWRISTFITLYNDRFNYDYV